MLDYEPAPATYANTRFPALSFLSGCQYCDPCSALSIPYLCAINQRWVSPARPNAT